MKESISNLFSNSPTQSDTDVQNNQTTLQSKAMELLSSVKSTGISNGTILLIVLTLVGIVVYYKTK